MTCQANYVITQADLDNGSVTNTAKAKGSFGGKDVFSNEDSRTVNALQQGGLSLTKNADPTSYDHVGQLISYRFVVKNTGNVTLAGPFTVNDNKVGAVSCPPGSLAPGASVTCTTNHTITQADLDAGALTNIATASGNGLTSNQAQATVTAQQTRALAIDKTAQEATYAAVGDVIHYSYKVTNTGNVTLHDSISITVNDNKATATCPALPAGGLAPGAWITCSATYTIKQSDLDAGSLTNVASATDGTTTSPTDTVTVPATQSPALALIKTRQPGDLHHGRPDDQLQLRVEKHRQRDPQRAVHGHRRQGDRHLPGRGQPGPQRHPDLHGQLHDHAGRSGRRLGQEHGAGPRLLRRHAGPLQLRTTRR